VTATELNLNQNQISALPESIASCSRLKTLRLEENCLSLDAIPKSLLSDSKVSTLQLAGNMFDEKKLADVDGYEKYIERFTAVRRKLD
jgi:Leucine-rich repeat (LRR) protein